MVVRSAAATIRAAGEAPAISDFGVAAESDKGQWVQPTKHSFGLAGHQARSG